MKKNPRMGPGPARAKQLHGCVWALWAPGALDHGPYGPQGPWAHKTKMFLLSSYYVVIIILIMMIQGQGPRP